MRVNLEPAVFAVCLWKESAAGFAVGGGEVGPAVIAVGENLLCL